MPYIDLGRGSLERIKLQHERLAFEGDPSVKKGTAGGVNAAAKDSDLYPSGGLALFLNRTLNQKSLEVGESRRTRRRWVLARNWHNRPPCPLEQGERNEPNSELGLGTTIAPARGTGRLSTIIVEPLSLLGKSSSAGMRDGCRFRT